MTNCNKKYLSILLACILPHCGNASIIESSNTRSRSKAREEVYFSCIKRILLVNLVWGTSNNVQANQTGNQSGNGTSANLVNNETTGDFIGNSTTGDFMFNDTDNDFINNDTQSDAPPPPPPPPPLGE